jgi:hypothetical protein
MSGVKEDGMKTKTLHVRLDTTATPPVTVVEDSVSLGQHNFDINWVPDSGQSGWVFDQITQSDQRTALPDPPFAAPTITPGQITVQDSNKAPVDHGTFQYSICVKVGTTPYWSDPEIINRGGN